MWDSCEAREESDRRGCPSLPEEHDEGQGGYPEPVQGLLQESMIFRAISRVLSPSFPLTRGSLLFSTASRKLTSSFFRGSPFLTAPFISLGVPNFTTSLKSSMRL